MQAYLNCKAGPFSGERHKESTNDEVEDSTGNARHYHGNHNDSNRSGAKWVLVVGM